MRLSIISLTIYPQIDLEMDGSYQGDTPNLVLAQRNTKEPYILVHMY